MAKLHDTSVTGNINASGTIYANGKAVAPLDHTHSVEAITGLDKSVKDIVNATPVANATNATQLAGKTADQYALKSDLTALGESLNTVQYAITKVFKCPRYVSHVYDNKYMQVKLASKFVNNNDINIIVEDSRTKYTITGTTNFGYDNIKFGIKKMDAAWYFDYTGMVDLAVYKTAPDNFVFGGIGISDEPISVTVQSSQPIDASDFTLLPRDMSVNYNNLTSKVIVPNTDIIPFISDNFNLERNVYKVGTTLAPGRVPSFLSIPNIRDGGQFVVYDLTNKIVIRIGGLSHEVLGYYKGSSIQDPRVLKRNNAIAIDLSTLSTNLAIYGNCLVRIKYDSNIPSYMSSVPLVAQQPESVAVGSTPTLADISRILHQSITINGITYDTNSDIDLRSTQSFPATAINGQSITIGGENTITARANGGNADTVGGLSPNSFITTDKLARSYYSKVAVYDNDNRLIHPDGTEEWIEYQRPQASEDNLDHL